MTLIVHEDEDLQWEVLDYYIETYQLVYSGPDDEEGVVQFDKATFQISLGDKIQFWNLGLSLHDPANDTWFEASEIVTFVQEPVFQFEFLEFEDEFGELLEYHYAIWAEDASDNATLSDLTASARVMDSPFGNMLVFVDPSGHFEVQTPQDWIEEEPDPSVNEVYVAFGPEGNFISISVDEDVLPSLTEYADALETGFLEAGWEVIAKETVRTAQDLPAALLEYSFEIDGVAWAASMLLYLTDDGIGVGILYGFPADEFEEGRELAYYSFGTFRVN